MLTYDIAKYMHILKQRHLLKFIKSGTVLEDGSFVIREEKFKIINKFEDFEKINPQDLFERNKESEEVLKVIMVGKHD